MQGDDPPYLSVGTAVSAKYKGAFCEAKVSKVVRIVKCKVTYKMGLGNATVSDEQIKGTLRVGQIVQAKHADKKEFVDATITKIQDCSQYTVVFDDGDITTLRRTALCLKSGRHFNESETLDQLPLTHPEHFGNPVVGSRRGRRSRQLKEESSEGEAEEEEQPHLEVYCSDIGRVVSVEASDKKRNRDNWFPGLVVIPSAQPTVRINVKDEFLVRSFKDGRYYTVPKKEVSEFNRELAARVESTALAEAVEKTLKYLDNDELPAHWERNSLFNMQHQYSDSDDILSDSSDDEPREEKDHFVATLYKFMDDAGTPLNKSPVVAQRDVDLYRLFRLVGKLGGYNRTTNQNKWRAIAVRLKYASSVAISNQVKLVYRKCLLSYESFYRTLGCTMLSHPRSANRNRGSRTLIRDKDRVSTPVQQPQNSPRGGATTAPDEERDENSATNTSTNTAVSIPTTNTIVAVAGTSGTGTTTSTSGQNTATASTSTGGNTPTTSSGRRVYPSSKRLPVVVLEKKEEESGGGSSRRRTATVAVVVKESDESSESSESEEDGEASSIPAVAVTPTRTSTPPVSREVGRPKRHHDTTPTLPTTSKSTKDRRGAATTTTSSKSSTPTSTIQSTTPTASTSSSISTISTTNTSVANSVVSPSTETKTTTTTSSLTTIASSETKSGKVKSLIDKYEETATSGNSNQQTTRSKSGRSGGGSDGKPSTSGSQRGVESSTTTTTVAVAAAAGERKILAGNRSGNSSRGTVVSGSGGSGSGNAGNGGGGGGNGVPPSSSGSAVVRPEEEKKRGRKRLNTSDEKVTAMVVDTSSSTTTSSSATRSASVGRTTPSPSTSAICPTITSTTSSNNSNTPLTNSSSSSVGGGSSGGLGGGNSGDNVVSIGGGVVGTNSESGWTGSVSVGDKLRVFYGPTHESKVTYEAKVLEVDNSGAQPVYLVHYTGWNNRYDEYIHPHRIAENLSVTAKAKRLKHGNSGYNHKSYSVKPAAKRGRGMSITGRSTLPEVTPPPPPPPPPLSSTTVTRSTTPSSVASSSASSSRTKSPATTTGRNVISTTAVNTTRSSRHQQQSQPPQPESSSSGGNGRRTRRMSVLSQHSEEEEVEEESMAATEDELDEDEEDSEKCTTITGGSSGGGGGSVMTTRGLRGKSEDNNEPLVQPGLGKTVRRRLIKTRGDKRKDDDDTEKEEEPPEKPKRTRKLRKIVEIKPKPPLDSDDDDDDEDEDDDDEEEVLVKPKGRDFDLNQIRSELKGLTTAKQQNPVESVSVDKETLSSADDESSVDKPDDGEEKTSRALDEIKKEDKSSSSDDIYEFKEPEPFDFEMKITDEKNKKRFVATTSGTTRVFDEVVVDKVSPKKKSPSKEVEESKPPSRFGRKVTPVKKEEEELKEEKALTLFDKLVESPSFNTIEKSSTEAKELVTRKLKLDVESISSFSDLPVSLVDNDDDSQSNEQVFTHKERLFIDNYDKTALLDDSRKINDEDLKKDESDDEETIQASIKRCMMAEDSNDLLLHPESFYTKEEMKVLSFTTSTVESEDGASCSVIKEPIFEETTETGLLEEMYKAKLLSKTNMTSGSEEGKCGKTKITDSLLEKFSIAAKKRKDEEEEEEEEEDKSDDEKSDKSDLMEIDLDCTENVTKVECSSFEKLLDLKPKPFELKMNIASEELKLSPAILEIVTATSASSISAVRLIETKPPVVSTLTESLESVENSAIKAQMVVIAENSNNTLTSNTLISNTLSGNTLISREEPIKLPEITPRVVVTPTISSAVGGNKRCRKVLLSKAYVDDSEDSNDSDDSEQRLIIARSDEESQSSDELDDTQPEPEASTNITTGNSEDILTTTTSTNPTAVEDELKPQTVNSASETSTITISSVAIPTITGNTAVIVIPPVKRNFNIEEIKSGSGVTSMNSSASCGDVETVASVVVAMEEEEDEKPLPGVFSDLLLTTTVVTSSNLPLEEVDEEGDVDEDEEEEEEEESCNKAEDNESMLLCEETIPGSPAPPTESTPTPSTGNPVTSESHHHNSNSELLGNTRPSSSTGDRDSLEMPFASAPYTTTNTKLFSNSHSMMSGATGTTVGGGEKDKVAPPVTRTPTPVVIVLPEVVREELPDEVVGGEGEGDVEMGGVAAVLVDNTPPTTPESTISNQSPRGDNGGLSPESIKSLDGTPTTSLSLETIPTDTSNLIHHLPPITTTIQPQAHKRRTSSTSSSNANHHHHHHHHLHLLQDDDSALSNAGINLLASTSSNLARANTNIVTSITPIVTTLSTTTSLTSSQHCKKRRRSAKSGGDGGESGGGGAKRGRKPLLQNRSRQNSDSDDDTTDSVHSGMGGGGGYGGGVNATLVAISAAEHHRLNRSPRPGKYNFVVEFDPNLDSSQRIAMLQQKLVDLRKTYSSVKAELVTIERRRKKIRRKEREALKAAKQELACA